MNKFHDPFPQTPEGFHLRVENTLMRMEEEEMKYVRKYSMKVLAVAAAIFMLITATAVAVVQGHALRDRFTQLGTPELAEKVQDVHAVVNENGFGVTIDEIIWEGDQVYFSYTITVPDDGNTYLFGLYLPTINGVEVVTNFTGYLDDMQNLPHFPVRALGGEFPTTYTDVLERLYPYGNEGFNDFTDNMLKLRVGFLKANLPLECMGDGLKYREQMVEAEHRSKHCQFLVDLQPDSNAFYYFNSGLGEVVPYIDLMSMPEVYEMVVAQIAEAENIDDSFFGEEVVDSVMVDRYYDNLRYAQYIYIRDLPKTGLVDFVDVLEATAILPAFPVEVGACYNDVKQAFFQFDDYSIEISELMLTHTGGHIKWILYSDNIAEYWNQNIDIRKMDGSCISSSGECADVYGRVLTDAEGKQSLLYDMYYKGVINLDEVKQLKMMPVMGYEGMPGQEMKDTIVLEPIYNPEIG